MAKGADELRQGYGLPASAETRGCGPASTQHTGSSSWSDDPVAWQRSGGGDDDEGAAHPTSAIASTVA